MEKVKVDLLSEENRENLQENQQENRKLVKEQYKAPRRYNIKKIIVSIIIVIVICLAVFSSSIIFSDENLIRSIAKFNILEQVGKLIGARNKELIGEADDRINVLLIGMGGRGHEGGTLADTIILGSFKPSTNQVAMLSIPRDLSIPAPGYDYIKINALHAYAERDEEGSGGKVVASALSNLLGEKINYYTTVDFSGFERLIDEFGGVEVFVERNLIDPQYPIRGKEYVFPLENRYETLNIEKGWQQMDGALALKYARSRHALGIEGSDFARSKRQQKILAALKDKIFTLGTFLNPKRINSLLSAYNEHIYTNLEIWEMLRLAQIGREVDISKIISYTLSDGPSGMVYSKIVNSAYVLLPNDGTYGEIKTLWQNIFYAPESEILTNVVVPGSENKTASSTDIEQPAEGSRDETSLQPEKEDGIPTILSGYQAEGATISIQNGTWTTGKAGQQKKELEDKGFEVISAENADTHDYEKTVIYDFSRGDFPATSAELAKIYQTTVGNAPISLSSDTDFVIILGTK